jgi:hypothetical protein
VGFYRQKDDRRKINEYGERVLKADDTNFSAMILLARTYAKDRKP